MVSIVWCVNVSCLDTRHSNHSVTKIEYRGLLRYTCNRLFYCGEIMLKNIHVTAVAITLILFVLRGFWMITQSSRLQQRWVRVLPHVNDTILLVSAIALAVSMGQYPFVHAWLTAKVIALLAYIGLGMIAIRHGRRQGQRITAWLAALLVFGYMVSVAVTKSASGFFGILG